MIRLEGIGKTFASAAGGPAATVLAGVNLHVNRGEYIAIMGPSGCGKTTLMNIIGCLDKPSTGSYLLDGIDALALDDAGLSRVRNSKLGFVFQLFHLMHYTTVLNNVLLPLLYTETYPADAEQRALRALATVGLEGRHHDKPNILSGGEQQRVAIARALITDPAILLADEPTGNLDRSRGGEIMDIFGELNRQGRTIVLVTHDKAVAGRAHRAYKLDDGVLEPEDLGR